MKGLRILAALVLIDFLILTGYTISQFGPVGWVAPLMDNAATIQVTVDLVLALVVALGFVVKDAREKGVNPIPFVVLTLFSGSVGLLAYVAAHLGRKKVENEAQAAKVSRGTTTLAAER